MVICIYTTTKNHLSKWGVHLINPNEHDITDAVEHAKKHGFKTVYIHTTES